MAAGLIHQWASVGAARAERAGGRSGARSGAGKCARWSGAQPGLEVVCEPGGTYVESPESGMHALRHFYASVLLDAGENIKALAEYLGHSDPGLTLRVYAHLMPSSQERTRKAVTAVFGTARPEPSST